MNRIFNAVASHHLAPHLHEIQAAPPGDRAVVYELEVVDVRAASADDSSTSFGKHSWRLVRESVARERKALMEVYPDWSASGLDKAIAEKMTTMLLISITWVNGCRGRTVIPMNPDVLREMTEAAMADADADSTMKDDIGAGPATENDATDPARDGK